eukprot:1155545-Pelagomonas_calceolata.AAC.7
MQANILFKAAFNWHFLEGSRGQGRHNLNVMVQAEKGPAAEYQGVPKVYKGYKGVGLQPEILADRQGVSKKGHSGQKKQQTLSEVDNFPISLDVLFTSFLSMI